MKHGCDKWIADGKACENCEKFSTCDVVKAYTLCYKLNKLNS